MPSSFACSVARRMSSPSSSNVSSLSVTTTATSTRTSTCGSSPVISQSIHTSGSVTPQPYGSTVANCPQVKKGKGDVVRLPATALMVGALAFGTAACTGSANGSGDTSSQDDANAPVQHPTALV